MMRNKAMPRQLATVTVRRSPRCPSQGLLIAGSRTLHCALGRSGIRAFKREGDGATPLAPMSVLAGYTRAPVGATRLPIARIRPDMGWCDAPGSRNYNRPVRLPYTESHETLRRADHLYDVVIVLDWNIRPRMRNRGSAIFMHLARDGYRPTEGCVALSRRDMMWLLPRLSRRTKLQVRI